MRGSTTVCFTPNKCINTGVKVPVVLTHDVDWPRHGPPRDHILARLHRFPEEIRGGIVAGSLNPYYNIPDIMDLEEKFGFKSTFFFRIKYDDGSSVHVYEDDIKDLVRNGWEVGLHVNDALRVDLELQVLEELEVQIFGTRVHYLRLGPGYYASLSSLGVVYDSSVKFCRDRICMDDLVAFRVCGIVVLPVTIMDAYLFTYMKISEDRVPSIVERAIEAAKMIDGVVTIDWHQCSLKMIGGRSYARVLELLSSRDDVVVVRGIDFVRMFGEGSYSSYWSRRSWRSELRARY